MKTPIAEGSRSEEQSIQLLTKAVVDDVIGTQRESSISQIVSRTHDQVGIAGEVVGPEVALRPLYFVEELAALRRRFFAQRRHRYFEVG